MRSRKTFLLALAAILPVGACLTTSDPAAPPAALAEAGLDATGASYAITSPESGPVAEAGADAQDADAQDADAQDTGVQDTGAQDTGAQEAGVDCVALSKGTGITEAKAAMDALHAALNSASFCGPSGACHEFVATSGSWYGVANGASTAALDSADAAFWLKYGALTADEKSCYPLSSFVRPGAWGCVSQHCYPA